MGGVNSTEDTRQYRAGYPGKADDVTATKNLEFYKKWVAFVDASLHR